MEQPHLSQLLSPLDFANSILKKYFFYLGYMLVSISLPLSPGNPKKSPVPSPSLSCKHPAIVHF